MSRSAVLRRAAGVVVTTTLVLGSGPLVGRALAVDPALQSTSPADGSTVAPPATISATYDIALQPTVSTIVVTDGSMTPVPGSSTLVNASKTVQFTPTNPLTEADGPYDVEVTAKEAVPGTGLSNDSFSFSVDETPPVLTGVTMSTPTTVSGTTTTDVTGSVNGAATINISINDTNGATPPVTASTTTSGAGAFAANDIDVTSLSDGTLTATVTATDAVGNTSAPFAPAPTTVKDTTGPSLVSSDPVDGSRVQSRTQVIATYDEALDTATSSLVVTNKNGNPQGGVTSFSNGDKTITFTAAGTLNEAGSPYVGTVTAKDLTGNSTTTVIDFVVDDTPPGAPTVTLADPVNDANQAAVPVSGTAEPGSTVNISVDDAGNVGTLPVTTTAPAHATTGAYSTSVNLTSLDDGTVTATVTATDVAGNTGGAGTDTATKDTGAPAAPTVSIDDDPITSTNKTSVTVSGTAEADATVNVSVDDAATPGTAPVTGSTTATGGTWTLELDLSSLADGTVTASATATDAAGNTGAAGTDTATKDAGVPAAPSVTIAPDPINAANQTSVTVSGTAEPSSTVALEVTDGVTTLTPTPVTAHATTGAYSFTLDVTTLADGTVTASATAEDAAGNISPAGTDTATKDVDAPDAPGLLLPAFVNNANKAAVPVSGTAEPGASVSVTFSDGTPAHDVTVTTSANGSGDWSTTANLTGQDDGTISVSATATDLAGNPSTATTDSVTKDVVAPATPTVTMPDVDTGNESAVPLSGNAETGATVAVSVDDGDPATAPVTGSTTAAGGTWSLNLDLSTLTDGTLTATVTATDPAGNPSAAGTDTASKDTIVLALSSTSPVDGSVVQPPTTISGTFNEPVDPAQTTLVVRDSADGVFAGSTSFSNGNRTVTFTPSAPLSQAGSPYTATFDAEDPAGDTLHAVISFEVDSSAPATPTVTMTNPINAGNVTTVTVSGVAEPSSSVQVSVNDGDGGTAPVTSTVSADGTTGAYTTTLNLSTLVDGTITASVVATDVASNASAPGTATSMKDTALPATPTVTLTDPVNDSNKATATVSGTAEASSSVAVSVTDGVLTVTSTVTALPAGTYSATVDLTTLADGLLTATAVSTDAAGNASGTGSDTATKDVVHPGAPTVVMGDVTAANASAFPVSGVAEAGSTVTVSVDDADGGTGPVSTSTTAHATTGAYAVSLDVSGLDDGPVTANATATDAAGNASTAGTDTATKDTVVPAAPTVTLVDPVTHANQDTAAVSGTAEAGSTVNVSVDDANGVTSAVAGSDVADASTGAWSVTLDLSGLDDGTLTASATATDGVGNTSAATTDTATKNVAQAVTIAGLPGDPGAPVSGTQYDLTVTVHSTFAPGSPADSAYTGTPVLTAPGDGHFTGTCTAAVAGVAQCADVVFGDLGPATLTATDGDLSATEAVTVQPTSLVFSPAPPTKAKVGVAANFTVVPTAGVVGASIAEYNATRTLATGGGGSSPANGTVLACPAGSCTFSVTFSTGGVKTVSVIDDGSPARLTPTATLVVPHPTTLTIARSPATANWGQFVTVSGRLTRTLSGAAVTGQQVRIYARVLPNTTYRLVRLATTNSTGNWSTTVPVSQHTIFQAVHMATANTERADSALARVNVRVRVIIQSPANGSSFPLGTVLRVTGYSKPLKPGQLFYLVWRRADGSRAVLQSVRAGSDGVFRFARAGLGRGTYTLFVLTGNSTVNLGNQSPFFQVRIT